MRSTGEGTHAASLIARFPVVSEGRAVRGTVSGYHVGTRSNSGEESLCLMKTEDNDKDSLFVLERLEYMSVLFGNALNTLEAMKLTSRCQAVEKPEYWNRWGKHYVPGSRA